MSTTLNRTASRWRLMVGPGAAPSRAVPFSKLRNLFVKATQACQRGATYRHVSIWYMLSSLFPQPRRQSWCGAVGWRLLAFHARCRSLSHAFSSVGSENGVPMESHMVSHKRVVLRRALNGGGHLLAHTASQFGRASSNGLAFFGYAGGENFGHGGDGEVGEASGLRVGVVCCVGVVVAGV